ncbi:MAG: hypothetical protein P1P74_11635 [Desulfuromonadales bacterium]|nr:hypothetical protein [Desulfuromonadales bacterium]
MEKSIYLLAFVMTVAWSSATFAEPVAPLATPNAYGKQSFAVEGKTIADVEKELPSKEMVDIPAYPGSLFAMGSEANGELSSVQLISTASPAEVIAWYKKTLGKDWQYSPNLAIKEAGQVGVFVNTHKKNISAMDALKHRQLSVSKVEKPGDTGFIEMMFDVTGIRSMIVMTLKPMM